MAVSSRSTAVPPPGTYRSPTLRSFLLFVVVFGALFSWEVHAIFFKERGVPEGGRGERPMLVGEVAGDRVVTQGFEMRLGGLSGITIEAAPFDGRVDGEVVFTVYQVETDAPREAGMAPTDTDVEREVARVRVDAREVVSQERFTVAFPPLEESEGRRYRLEIRAPDVPAGRGLGFWASREQTYLGGVLTVDGQEQWGDLVFKAHAARATVFGKVEHRLREQPRWLRSRWTLGTLAVLYNWALATFTWYMLFVEDETEGHAS